MAIPAASVPDFDDLPPVEGMPQGCTWGIFDKDGKKDLLGTLSFLTTEVVKNTAAEVKDGVSISLNAPLNVMDKFNILNRAATKHDILYLPEYMANLSPSASAWDELFFNTQASSQWDSLCHAQHVPSGWAYNRTRPTSEKLTITSSTKNDLPTLEHWNPSGGLVCRGVLLDFKLYTERNCIHFHPLEGISIKSEDLEACAQFFGVKLKPADLLLVRTGVDEIFLNPSVKNRQQLQLGQMAGLDGSVDMARWLWNKRFVAVASDSLALERFPPLHADGTVADLSHLTLHQYMLNLFGMLIGELWDLKQLSKYCTSTKRFSFMVTSIPLNHPCLIGSPSNALAIF